MQQLAARLRPQLESVVKQNESAAGDTFVPGDFNQVHFHWAMAPSPCVQTGPTLAEIVGRVMSHCST